MPKRARRNEKNKKKVEEGADLGTKGKGEKNLSKRKRSGGTDTGMDTSKREKPLGPPLRAFSKGRSIFIKPEKKRVFVSSITKAKETIRLFLLGDNEQKDSAPKPRNTTGAPVETHKTKREKAERCTTRMSVFQITDPHIGLFMSEYQLRKLCETAIALDPQLILLTGDFFANEVHRGPECRELLRFGLDPLSAVSERCYACLGNHDYEGLPHIEAALNDVGITLLKDERTTHQLRGSEETIELIGTHFMFSHKRKGPHLEHISRKFPPHHITPSATRADTQPKDKQTTSTFATRPAARLMLVHDPKGMEHIPPKDKSILFAGHLHGGQVGLQNVGIDWTLGGALFKTPDQGLFKCNSNHMYVHRGNGQHALPFRLGVDRELSVLLLEILH